MREMAWAAVVACGYVVDARFGISEVGLARVGCTRADEFIFFGVVWRYPKIISDYIEVGRGFCHAPIGVGLVENMESWEVLPGNASIVLRAGGDVRGKQSPVP